MAPFDAGHNVSDWQDRTQRALSPLDPLLQFAEGAMLGPYCIERFLSKGGMGILYVARHERGGKRVALKVLNPQFNQQPDILKRFADEARAVNKIKHENIVEIYDFVQQPNGLNYLVMEFLEGRDLWRAREVEGPFAMPRILAVANATALALRAAHAHRIIHRDLKPENIFLVQRGPNVEFVKLLDFGIAKLIESTGHQTMTGLVMGTPEFMAPEQGLGARVDARADVYAFGVVLYWMLTGNLPFEGDQLTSFQARREGPPPVGLLSEAGDSIPDTLAGLVRHCLAFDREQRVGSMSEIIKGLQGRRPTTEEMPVAVRGRPTTEEMPVAGAALPISDKTQVMVVKNAMPPELPKIVVPAPSPKSAPITSPAVANLAPMPSLPSSLGRIREPRGPLITLAVVLLAGAGAGAWWLTRPEPPPPPRAQLTVPVQYPALMLQAEEPPPPAPALPKASPVIDPPKPSLPPVAPVRLTPAPPRPVHHHPKAKPQPEGPADSTPDLMPVE